MKGVRKHYVLAVFLAGVAISNSCGQIKKRFTKTNDEASSIDKVPAARSDAGQVVVLLQSKQAMTDFKGYVLGAPESPGELVDSQMLVFNNVPAGKQEILVEGRLEGGGLVGARSSALEIKNGQREVVYLTEWTGPGSIKGVLKPVGVQTGKITDLDLSLSGSMYHTKVDQDGNFLFEGVVPGSYALAATLAGKDFERIKNIQVKAGETLSLNHLYLYNNRQGDNGPLPQIVGGLVGNGGDAILCGNDPQTVESFDLFEARFMGNRRPDLGDATLPFAQKIDLVVSRWQRVDPIAAQRLRTSIDSFMRYASFLPDINLDNIADEGSPIFIPLHCALRQLAMQFADERLPSGTRFVINKDLFDSLDEDNKAALILHEILYSEARQKGATNSANVRFLNSTMLSSEGDTVSFPDYFQMATRAKFTILNLLPFMNVEYSQEFTQYADTHLQTALIGTGGSLAPDKQLGLLAGTLSEFYPAMTLKRGVLCAKADGENCPQELRKFDLGEGKTLRTLARKNSAANCMIELPTGEGTTVEFYDNLLPKTIFWNDLSLPVNWRLSPDKSFPTICFRVNNQKITIPVGLGPEMGANSAVEFYPNGTPKKVNIITSSMFGAPLDSALTECARLLLIFTAETSFHSNGRISRITNAIGESCRSVSGATVLRTIGTLEFNEDGLLIQ